MFETSQMFKFYNEGNIWVMYLAFVFVVESRKCFGENFQGPHNSDQIEVGLTIFNFLGVAIQQTIFRNIAIHHHRVTDPHHS